MKPESPRPCRHFRTKHQYVGPADPNAFRTSYGWCVRTMAPQGPDGEPVAREECAVGRACFEEANRA